MSPRALVMPPPGTGRARRRYQAANAVDALKRQLALTTPVLRSGRAR
jgi:hypothetical protein